MAGKKSLMSVLVMVLVTAAAPVAAAEPAARTGGPATAVADTAVRGTAENPRQYRVDGPRTKEQRTRVARTGAAIDAIEHSSIIVSATPSEAAAIRRLGFSVSEMMTALDFPPADSRYHNHAELTAAVDRVVAANPAIARKTVIGRSHEGRDIVAVKISDNVAVDENEPEVLFTAHQHAREHLTKEMAVYLLNLFTSGTEARVNDLVASREIWIIPDVNPDGGEYDIATGSYRSWRKNRQSNSTAVGTDLNRNWGHKWGCCNGSSSSGSSDSYRGRAVESAPEIKVVADFVRSRVVGGKQQITSAIDFHTYGELVLWPYSYTYDDLAPGLDRDQLDTFTAIGRSMASSNGYTPQQWSDMYIADGTINDWLWGNQKIFSFLFEMYPKSGNGGFYPPDEVIGRETSRNKEAVLRLLEYADCPYRAIGKQAQYCGGGRTFENATNYDIPDQGTVDSAITVSGVPGNAPAAMQIFVDIHHTWIGDLQIDLVAGDGSVYRLKDTNSSDSSDVLHATYTVNASSEVANGTWKLRVKDVSVNDSGYIDAWNISF
ncbi:M14 family zinc carboxypeptidase [Rhizohabitans arisaemae]|uniref:M14 family zinc carboxypeptidase n=1 Tax=Rhizohabitans arisaemae TaxID=2720610 RepID=UPI0024B267CF|nr:M14 family zinc carboxypeptidase [Rhizohabitans arisaemae]